MSDSATIEYFTKPVVEKAIADYFAKHGCTVQVRDALRNMVTHKEDDFFQMVCNYIERGAL